MCCKLEGERRLPLFRYLLPGHSLTVTDYGQGEARATSTPGCVLTMCCSVERKSLVSTRSAKAIMSL